MINSNIKIIYLTEEEHKQAIKQFLIVRFDIPVKDIKAIGYSYLSSRGDHNFQVDLTESEQNATPTTPTAS